MNALKRSCFLAIAALTGILTGCSTSPAHAPDIASSVRKALDQAGLHDVSSSDDRGKGVVTLGGHVPSEEDKGTAGYIAGTLAANQVVANEIAVAPPGEQSQAKAENTDFDRGIEMNLDAALLEAKLHDDVKYHVRNHTVTLTGDVKAEDTRARAQTIAAGVPNVLQVVNELQIRHQKATSSN
jgi:osmotically-inducible protein OsmY